MRWYEESTAEAEEFFIGGFVIFFPLTAHENPSAIKSANKVEVTKNGIIIIFLHAEGFAIKYYLIC